MLFIDTAVYLQQKIMLTQKILMSLTRVVDSTGMKDTSGECMIYFTNYSILLCTRQNIDILCDS